MASPDTIVVVVVADLRKCGFCVRGAQGTFESYGADWKKFCREGIPAADMAAWGDHNADRVIAAARERVATNG